MIDNHYTEYMELFKIDEEIKNELNNSLGIQNNFRVYGLLNSKWLEIYKIYLSEYYKGKPMNISFDVESLFPNYIKKDYSYLGANSNFIFSSDFSFVTQQFMKLLSNNYKNEKDKNRINNELYKIAIGGNCIIMKDQHNEIKDFMYIVIYDLKKGNINNNIDYILNITDSKEYDKACNYILKNNIWNYLKKINFLIDDGYKEIFNDENKKIGYIARNGTLIRINELKKMECENIKKIIQNEVFKEKLKISYEKYPKYNSVLLGLYQIRLFVNELIKYSQDIIKTRIIFFLCYFQNFEKGILYNENNKFEFSWLMKANSFKTIILDILSNIHLELSNEYNKYEYNKIFQFNENKEIEKFLNYHNNESTIIEKLFYKYLYIYYLNINGLIINITDNKEYDKACDYILKNNIWNYLKKINFGIEDEYKEIFNKNNKKIGFIARNGEINRINELKKMELENIMIQKENVGLLQQPKINYQINNKFNSVLLCLYQFKYFINELIKYSSDNNNNKFISSLFPYFINFEKGIIFNKNNQSIISGLIETDYNKIIIDIFEKINSELSKEQNENEFGQDDSQFDEKKNNRKIFKLS